MTYRTSEWVSPGHPDKVADGISEYILDRLLEIDPNTRYALEVQVKGDYVSLAGEITTKADVVDGDYHHWAKEAVNKIGYTRKYQEKWGNENTICGDDLIVVSNISQQSSDIANGVNIDGWGDQGIFTGYAENSHIMYMPEDKELAREIGLQLYGDVLTHDLEGGLDIKTQVTFFDEYIKQIVVAIPLLDESVIEDVKTKILCFLNLHYLNYVYKDVEIIVNGTGIYKQHGPIADAGTTGRKLAVDFYGNNAPIGGGCPWTKDGTKADLALNLYARHQAVKGLKKFIDIDNECHHATYQLCCCIGKQMVYGSLKVFDNEGKLLYNVNDKIDVKPSELIEKYGLKEPKYFEMCKNGMFEEIDYPWNDWRKE